MPEGELFERGLEVRREVLGAEYVDASMASADEFMLPFQQLLTLSGRGGTPGAGWNSTGAPAAC